MLFVVLCPGTPEGSTGSGSLCYLSQLFPYHYLAKRGSAYLVICFINFVGGHKI